MLQVNIGRQLDAQTQQDVRHQRRVAEGVEESHVGHGHERPLLPRARPRKEERLCEQSLLFLGKHIVHGSVVLRHQVLDGGADLRGNRLKLFAVYRFVANRVSGHRS